MAGPGRSYEERWVEGQGRFHEDLQQRGHPAIRYQPRKYRKEVFIKKGLNFWFEL